jgi:hypothetical protein
MFGIMPVGWEQVSRVSHQWDGRGGRSESRQWDGKGGVVHCTHSMRGVVKWACIWDVVSRPKVEPRVSPVSLPWMGGGWALGLWDRRGDVRHHASRMGAGELHVAPVGWEGKTFGITPVGWKGGHCALHPQHERSGEMGMHLGYGVVEPHVSPVSLLWMGGGWTSSPWNRRGDIRHHASRMGVDELHVTLVGWEGGVFGITPME